MLCRPATSAREQFGESRHSVLLFLQPFKGSFMPPPFFACPRDGPYGHHTCRGQGPGDPGLPEQRQGEPARPAGPSPAPLCFPLRPGCGAGRGVHRGRLHLPYLSDPAVASATTGSAPRRPPYRHRPSLKQPLKPCRPTLRGAVVACHRAVPGRFGAAQLRPSREPAARNLIMWFARPRMALRRA